MNSEAIMDLYDYPDQICLDVDTIGLPQIPTIPQLILCLHFPGSDGWNNHWAEFHQEIKEFHQTMIDFNWRILEWYFLKSKQLERFGKKTLYIAGTLVTAPRVTFIYTKTIFDFDVLTEVRKCLPRPVDEEIKHLERTGYKLFLSGKIFLFNYERVIAIDYEGVDCSKTCFKRCWCVIAECFKFNLFYKNEKVNMTEAYKRAYGGLKISFLIGGIGGLVTSYLTGYFKDPPLFTRGRAPERNLFWWAVSRFLSSATCYTIVERILLLRFTQPHKYILSGSTGVICGIFFGFCDNNNAETILHGAVEYGIFSLLCNLFSHKQIYYKGNRLGNSNKEGAIITK